MTQYYDNKQPSGNRSVIPLTSIYKSFEEGRHYNQSVERAVLGICMLEKAPIQSVTTYLTAADFYNTYHQIVFTTIKEMHADNRQIDILTVWDYLHNVRDIPKLGPDNTSYFLTTLTRDVVASTHVNTHCAILKQCTARRSELTANPTNPTAVAIRKRHFPYKFIRYLLKWCDPALIRSTAAAYGRSVIKGGAYSIQAPSPELVYMMHLIAPEYTWTINPADEIYTRQQCAAAVQKGKRLTTLKDGTRIWMDTTNNYPANW